MSSVATPFAEPISERLTCASFVTLLNPTAALERVATLLVTIELPLTSFTSSTLPAFAIFVANSCNAASTFVAVILPAASATVTCSALVSTRTCVSAPLASFTRHTFLFSAINILLYSLLNI